MKNSSTILIIMVVALIMSNLFFGYLLLKPKSQPRFREFQQMQLTDEQIQSVTSFFNSTTNTNKINDYCTENRMECFYYCRQINPNHEFCSQLMQRARSQQVQRLN